MRRILLIDNYDSFTYNLFQYLSELGAQVQVLRNDEVSLEECISLDPEAMLISPGPGRPRDTGIVMDVLKAFEGKIPILGVCLGHQAIVEFYGGKVDVAPEIVHGKTSGIHHDGKGLFLELPQKFKATRYHSLVALENSIPDQLEVTARTTGDLQLVMGVRHKKFRVSIKKCFISFSIFLL